MPSLPAQERPTRPATPADAEPGSVAELTAFVRRCRRLLVLTGAGCSTESGIPDYRDPDGEWKHRQPVTYQQFVGSHRVRQRYWAGSLAGWERVDRARPNAAHRALTALAAAGHLHWLITQNVDRLHQKAGSRRVIDLHGRLDKVICLGCRTRFARRNLQRELLRRNPGQRHPAVAAPDGDAAVRAEDAAAFEVPACARCGGLLKPDVVFFGEAIPPARSAAALARLEEADGLLVVGSSLMVWSGYRFVRRAGELQIPVAAVNLGRTRADRELALKVVGPCGAVLPRVAAELGAGYGGPR